jgi:hypothetical protein
MTYVNGPGSGATIDAQSIVKPLKDGVPEARRVSQPELARHRLELIMVQGERDSCQLHSIVLTELFLQAVRSKGLR